MTSQSRPGYHNLSAWSPMNPNLSNVRGLDLDSQTRGEHYHGRTDIIAIKTKCCGVYYGSKDCHEVLADHLIEVWPESEWKPEGNTLWCLRYGAKYRSVHELRIPMSGLSPALQSRMSKPLSFLFRCPAVREDGVKMAHGSSPVRPLKITKFIASANALFFPLRSKQSLGIVSGSTA
jgi:uncharacterized CHY-type Zn-finger protein